MRPSENIKSVSYLKAHTAEIIREINDSRQALIVTQNGEAKVVLQDVYSYEQTQESLAMLKILALSGQSIREGKVKPIAQAFADLERRISADT